MMDLSKTRRRLKAFTLTETAIVLLAVGVIVSAMWVAGEHVWDSHRIYRVNQEITSTVQNIRDYYGKSVSFWPWSAGTDETSQFDKLGLIPTEMRRSSYAAPGSSPIDHALNNDATNGSFHVLVTNNAITGQLNAIRIQLLNVSMPACIALLVGAPISDDSLGFLQMGTQGMAATSSMVINNGNTNGQVTSASISPTQAENWCNNANGINEVDFDFALHN